MILARTLVLVGLLVSFVGCSREPVAYPVAGVASYNGLPIAEGTIAFVPIDRPEFGPDGAVIKDGRFSLTVKAGKVKVEITGNRPITDPVILKKAGSPPPREDYIPAKHNTASTRILDINGPATSLDFQLEE